MATVQQPIIKLVRLLKVEAYVIISQWSNGDIRLNDFSDEIDSWRNGSNKELKKLVSGRVFKTAYVKDGTLAFSGSTVKIPGIDGVQPVDFDRRKLYADSILIGRAISDTNQKINAAHKSPAKRLTISPDRKEKSAYIFQLLLQLFSGPNDKISLTVAGEQFEFVNQ